MIPMYRPNTRLITMKIGKIINDLYWLVSNSGSSTQYPKIELGRDKTLVFRNLSNLLMMDEKDYVLYLAVMYQLDEEQVTVIHFRVTLASVTPCEFPDAINGIIKGVLNSDKLVHENGVVFNKDNFVKYVGLVGYADQYDVGSAELALFKMMISDEDIPPSTYEGIRLLEVNDFMGEFLNMCKRPYS